MTKVLEVSTTAPSLNLKLPTIGTEPNEKKADFIVHNDTWELMTAFQKLQQVYREGRVGERELVLEDYVRKVRRQGGDPQVHYQYALGLLALGLGQREPDRALVFERLLMAKTRTGLDDAEMWFRESLERMFGAALKPREGSRGDRLERIRVFLRAYFQGPVRLEGVASEFGFSTSSLGRRFKERFGVGFSAFLRDLRVEKAKELLREGRLSIEQVSRECGFQNFHYFFEVFKKATGQTPQKFRKTSSGLSDKF